MNTAINTIDGYISAFPEEVQLMLQAIREVIIQSAPGAMETIKYAMPTFVLNGNLVHFAGYKKHIGFYPAPAGIVAFDAELAGHVDRPCSDNEGVLVRAVSGGQA